MNSTNKIDTTFISKIFEEDRINRLKEARSKFFILDDFIEFETNKQILYVQSDLRLAHQLLLQSLKYIDECSNTKYLNFNNFKNLCENLKSNFKSIFKFEKIENDEYEYKQYRVTITKNNSTYTAILTENKHKEDWNYKYCSYAAIFDVNEDENYYLFKENVTEEYDMSVYRDSNRFNFSKMIRQIISGTKKEDKEYKLELRQNNDFFISSKKQINQNFNDLLEHIENSISEYDEELKHIVDGKKEYVFKDNEYVGESTLKLNSKARKVINKNKYTYDLFIKLLDIKFPNIEIIKFTYFLLHYKLKGKL
ncbi:hypothetical protein [Arcobacter defluvii]|uniref:Uncharacterized protein n=1 Tax=Arcobacter defluvii TaxID=873191 RepID=A0AAE7BGH8_9BACT|nr:hypothetical protein [Arcobacter defluvii]QKF77282.1 hypothetical protein ADFLV_1250 [Arcobacter defluvii]QKF77874.1 hypothetical protein ADFLV_1856 [Arcobacter defluvii]RXI32655.1 hypothetical protein CP964_07255 [Arcobacter defluvii]